MADDFPPYIQRLKHHSLHSFLFFPFHESFPSYDVTELS